MRTPVRRDDPGITCLREKSYISRALKDLQVIQVRPRSHWRSGVNSHDATVNHTSVLRAGSPKACRSCGDPSLLRLRRHRGNTSIRWIHHQGRSPGAHHRCSPVQIDTKLISEWSLGTKRKIVWALILQGRGIGPATDLSVPLFVCSRFLLGQHVFPCQLSGSFHGRKGREAPDPLQIRVAPRCAWYGSRVRRLSPGDGGKDHKQTHGNDTLQ